MTTTQKLIELCEAFNDFGEMPKAVRANLLNKLATLRAEAEKPPEVDVTDYDYLHFEAKLREEIERLHAESSLGLTAIEAWAKRAYLQGRAERSGDVNKTFEEWWLDYDDLQIELPSRYESAQAAWQASQDALRAKGERVWISDDGSLISGVAPFNHTLIKDEDMK